ncbi:MAG: DNA-directed RNA polymerase subunit beta [Oscillospiraceae bacterium]|nr:DNA-directed RNA polymerase subunit beta [Oscillospiraceae bacterium]MBR6208633.1 DNA-directed RNA polymerase subunit beta [Oscillospiraceae bacterium]
MPQDVLYGKTIRKSYARREEIQDMPHLLEIQKNSYKWFLEKGLREVFKGVEAITDYSGNLEMTFVDYSMNEDPKYDVEECKARDATYAAPIKVTVRLHNRETEEIKEQEIFMGDFPLMTPSGTFVINGAERVIVSQIVRSPGIYFDKITDKTQNSVYGTTIIPYHGAWLEYETDLNDLFYVRIDKTRKIPVTLLLKALGNYREDKPYTWLSCLPDTERVGGAVTSEALKEIFANDKHIVTTLDRDTCITRDDSLLEIYRKLRPGDPPTVESSETLLDGLFFDHRRYDISHVGRFKFNKKLALYPRVVGYKLAAPVADPMTGEVIAEEGEVLTREKVRLLERRAVNSLMLSLDSGETVRVFSNGMVNAADLLHFSDDEEENVRICREDLGLRESVRFIILRQLMEQYEGDELKEQIIAHQSELLPLHVIVDDIFSAANYLCCLAHGIGEPDDIDHLGNRRVRSVGELLQNQFRIGFSRMERVIRERMTLQDLDVVTPQSLINIRPVTAAIKEFFGSSPLSQFMDQTNPLAELTHKRRISALGPGGLTRERANFDVRDVHYSHYARLCPIETPEGPNIGLINYLSSYARVNEYGFLISPYRRIDKETGVVTREVVYMTADQEDQYIMAMATEPLDEEGRLLNKRVTCRHRDEIVEVDRDRVDFMDVSPRMMISIATAMIPFLENDDANRALMGANMQRQAVPLLTTQQPIVATGIEHRCAVDSGVVVLAEGDGEVRRVSADNITIRYDSGETKDYKLIKFSRSNQGTCFNQRPIVKVGERVKDGDVIADGPSTSQGEISLGKNILVGFTTWEGYNYEDAVMLNEHLVIDDVFTSIHIEEYECNARDTKLGGEEITRDIPGVGDDALKYLDETGVISIGAEVRSGDILVGKVTPKGETDLTAEERLLRAIFGEKAREVRDTSLRVPHGESGIIVDVKKFTRENGDEMSPGVNMVVRVYIAQKRKISVGDKMAGRHGNKGVVSRIQPREDMPYLPDGTPLDICLNPLGVPSRMNIGQVLEVHLGYAAQALGWKVATPIFNGANEETIRQTLKQAGLREDGKSVLYDGRTGEKFDSDITVGWVYFLKLHHLVDDKIHARSTGPYSLVTQQPLGGKAQFGGQRFGEMEVWALEAYGAAHTLQEILTVKSDDVTGRVRTYESIVKGHNIPEPGVPESFKVLVKELQALCLDIKVLDKDGQEIELKEDDDDDYIPGMRDDYRSSEEEFADAGFAIDRSQSVFGDAPADDYDMGGDAEDIADDAEEEE